MLGSGIRCTAYQYQLRISQILDLANAQIAKRGANLCRLAGYEVPTICTPEELLEEPTNEETWPVNQPESNSQNQSAG